MTGAILHGLQRSYASKFLTLSTVLVLVFGFSFISNVAADALSQQQIEDLQSGVLYFNTDTCSDSSDSTSSASSSASTSLSSGSSVYILGDSITDRAAPTYVSTLQKQGISANLDFADARGLATPGNGDSANTNNLTGTQAVAQDTNEIRNAGAIVIALGTNDINNDDTAQNVDNLITSIRSDNANAPIYWVDVYAIDSSLLTSAQVGQINSVIYGEASKDNYHVISWFNTVDANGNPQNPSNPESDPNNYIDMTDGYGVHPDAAGVPALVNLVVNELTSSSTASNSSTSSCCGASVGGPSAGGPLLDVQFPEVADTSALATNINNYIQSYKSSSPLAGMGSVFVQAGQKYDVNPALMVAIAQKESSMGVNEPSGSHDAWGLNDFGDVANYPFEDGIYFFPSWTVGIYAATQYVGDTFALPGSPDYSITVLQLMKHYTPDTKANPNEAEEQATVTLAAMQKIVNGLSTSGTSSTTPAPTPTTTTSTSGSSCSGSTTPTASSTGGLSNPFPDGWIPGRLDMGYDGHFTTEIAAPCSGTMSYVDADSNHSYNGGWNGAYFTLECSQQPSGLPTSTFYFAEGVQPTVTQGQMVSSGQQIGVPGWTGYTEGPGGIEWGLAVSSNPQLAYAASLGNSCAVGSASQKMVMSFSQWVQQNLHVAPPGSTNHAGCA